MRALVTLCLSLNQYALLEIRNGTCVALVKEVSAPAPAAMEGEEEAGEAACGGGNGVVGHQQEVTNGRAEVSANLEGPKAADSAAGSPGGQAAGAGAEQLREAMRRGSVSELLELGVPRLEAGGLCGRGANYGMRHAPASMQATLSSSRLPLTFRAAGACAPRAVVWL